MRCNGAREMAMGVAAELRQKTKLLEIHCPNCNASHEVAKMKLVSKTGGFSNLKCKASRCGQTASSTEWRCRCRRMWIKCPIHLHVFRQARKPSCRFASSTAKKQSIVLGTNAPMPKQRQSTVKGCIRTCLKGIEDVNKEYQRIRFPLLSSVLAKKFAYLVQPEGSMDPTGGSA